MEAAERLGIPLRVLDGWTPRTVTTHHYDQAGRMTHSVTRTESAWDDHERAWMEALGLARALTCAECRGWLPETMHTSAEDWAVPPPGRCGRCDAIAIRQEMHTHPRPHLARWTADRRRG